MTSASPLDRLTRTVGVFGVALLLLGVTLRWIGWESTKGVHAAGGEPEEGQGLHPQLDSELAASVADLPADAPEWPLELKRAAASQFALSAPAPTELDDFARALGCDSWDALLQAE